MRQTNELKLIVDYKIKGDSITHSCNYVLNENIFNKSTIICLYLSLWLENQKFDEKIKKTATNCL